MRAFIIREELDKKASKYKELLDFVTSLGFDNIWAGRENMTPLAGKSDYHFIILDMGDKFEMSLSDMPNALKQQINHVKHVLKESIYLIYRRRNDNSIQLYTTTIETNSDTSIFKGKSLVTGGLAMDVANKIGKIKTPEETSSYQKLIDEYVKYNSKSSLQAGILNGNISPSEAVEALSKKEVPNKYWGYIDGVADYYKGILSDPYARRYPLTPKDCFSPYSGIVIDPFVDTITSEKAEYEAYCYKLKRLLL